MYIVRQGIFLPYLKIRLHVYVFDSVQRGHIHLADGLVVFGRIACRYYEPVFRYGHIAETLVLKQLEHDRRQGLRHAVYLVEEQYAASFSRHIHVIVYGCHYLAHRILSYRKGSASVFLMGYVRKTYGALPCVVGHGIGNQSAAFFLCDLLHDGSLSYARRPYEENWALFFHRYPV